LAALLATIQRAWATTVVDTATNTVVFSDNYDNQSVDSALSSASINPGPGTYSTAPSGVLTRNGVSPGAYQGTSYVEIDRQNPAKSGSATRLTENFDTPIPVGSAMQATFAYNLVSGYFQIQLYDSAGATAWGLYASPGEVDGRRRFLDVLSGDGHISADTTSLTVGALNAWHEMTFTYMVGASSVDLTVDGVTETVNNVTMNAIANVSRLRFTGDGSSTTHFYLDAVPSPMSHPGDFDGDGDADGADFVAWQTNFPTVAGATLVQGDADGDGDVDGADFVAWQTSFTTGPDVTSVPEPHSIPILATVLVTLGFCQAARRGKSTSLPSSAACAARDNDELVGHLL
jgi:hypothetical protein